LPEGLRKITETPNRDNQALHQDLKLESPDYEVGVLTPLYNEESYAYGLRGRISISF
jgi:hypothetical protein